MFVNYRVSDEDIREVTDGNTPSAGETYPMLVVKEWGEGVVNGRVFLDGLTILWVTSRKQGTGQGQWTPIPS